jgi:hypothetical protein
LRRLFCGSKHNYCCQKCIRNVNEDRILHYELFASGGKRNEGCANGGEAGRSNLGDDIALQYICMQSLNSISFGR